MSRQFMILVLIVLVACARQPGGRVEQPADHAAPGAGLAEQPAGPTGAGGEAAPALSVAGQVRAIDARLANLEATPGSADMRGTMCRYRAY